MNNPFEKQFLELKQYSDPGVNFIVEHVGPPDQRIPSTFSLDEAVFRIVIAQMLSAKAAQTIQNRMLQHFESVENVYRWVQEHPGTSPGHGLSASKIRSLQSWAGSDRRKSGLPATIAYTDLESLFSGIRGFGPWSRDMLAIFHLALPDVWPLGDLVVRNAAQRLWENAVPPVQPHHRTVLALSCWHAAHMGVEIPDLVNRAKPDLTDI